MRLRPAALVFVFLSVGGSVRPAAAQCPDGSSPPCRSGRVAAPPPKSIAVLYFENLSPDTTDAYLADGLTEQVLSHLGRVNRLSVKRVSRLAAHRLRDSVPDYVVALGRVLSVRYIVEGSVRRAGPRLRVSARLVRTRDGIDMWREDYDRVPSDLLLLEDDIARQVARAVTGQLTPSEVTAIGLGGSRDPIAHEHYLRGNFYLSRRTAPAMTRALDEYGSAVAIDSGFVEPLARIGYTYSLCFALGAPCGGLSPDSLLNRARGVSELALARDSNSAEAWLARGSVVFGANDAPSFRLAQRALERSLALAPRNSEAWHVYGVILRAQGEDSAAAVAYHRALEIEPYRPTSLNGLGAAAFFAHDFAASSRWLDSALTLDPAFPLAYHYRARVRILLSDTTGALADAEMFLRLTGSRLIVVTRALVAALRGDTAETRRSLEYIQREVPDDFEGQAALLVALHEYEDALSILERARPLGLTLWGVLRDPELDSLRFHPRFQRLFEETRPR